MGGSSSKSDDDNEESVFDTMYISWDEKGNLRYGLVHPVTRQKQLREILSLDFVDEENGKTWYIMDSAWIEAWLAYVNINKGIAPCPGSCNNTRLIIYDYQLQKYVKRPGLIMAVQDRGGDFRRVSEEVWLKFKEYYPESGPAISMVYSEDDAASENCEWNVLDTMDPPIDKDKKKRKLNFPNFLSKKDNSKTAKEINIDNSEGVHSSGKLNNSNNIAALINNNNDNDTAIESNNNKDATGPLTTTGGTRNVKNEAYFEDVYFGKEK